MTTPITPFEEQLLFYFNYGTAMNQWTYIEHALSQLACAGVGDPGRKSLAVGLYAIESFRSKLNYVDALLQHRFNGSADLATWARLMERAVKASARRNQLAHRSVVIYTGEKVGKQYALVDWRQRSTPGNDEGTAPKGAMGLREIVECWHLFSSLSIELEKLAAKLENREYPFPDNEPVKTPTLDVLLQQGRSMLSGLYPAPQTPASEP
jgi:hypothetical protein